MPALTVKVPAPLIEPVPPEPVTVTTVVPPLHKIGGAVAPAVTDVGLEIVIDVVAEQPLKSDTV